MGEESLGASIRRVRLARGDRQEDLAQKIGLSERNQGRVSKWERDEQRPNPEARPGLAAYLGITVEELDEKAGPPRNNGPRPGKSTASLESRVRDLAAQVAELAGEVGALRLEVAQLKP